jgi:hypothetical protein
MMEQASSFLTEYSQRHDDPVIRGFALLTQVR